MINGLKRAVAEEFFGATLEGFNVLMADGAFVVPKTQL